MTLSKMERPKSKQTMKAMPSLKNARAALDSANRSKKPEIKAFSGQGVRLGGYDEPEEEKKSTKPNMSFSGLKIENKGPQVKIEARYRCLKCYNLNKAENVQCSKCFFKRDLT
jgi:hypothetical protein